MAPWKDKLFGAYKHRARAVDPWSCSPSEISTTSGMAITNFEFLRFRKKKKEQDGDGDQVLNAIEEREKVVQEDAAAAVANAEVDLILLLTRKQWRLIRISSFLYVLSCIFLLLVSYSWLSRNALLIFLKGRNR